MYSQKSVLLPISASFGGNIDAGRVPPSTAAEVLCRCNFVCILLGIHCQCSWADVNASSVQCDNMSINVWIDMSMCQGYLLWV